MQRYYYFYEMSNISILHPSVETHSVSFELHNESDSPKSFHVQDITLYSFMRTIDWVNNAFTWVELRTIESTNKDELKKYIINADDITENVTIPILCCCRIPEGSYVNAEAICERLNDAFSDSDSISLQSITPTHNVVGSGFDIDSVIIEMKENRDCIWCPAILHTSVLNTVYNIPRSTDNDVAVLSTSNECIPVLELLNGELVSPPATSVKHNNVLYYYADILSKLSSGSLTSHAITFVNSITATLGIDMIKIKETDAISNEYGLVRHLENHVNYTEYIIQPRSDLIKEITDKNQTTKKDGIKYTFMCAEYPFFPISDKLYIRSCATKNIDSLIEEQYSTTRIFGNSLGIVDVPASWRNVQQMMNGGVIDLIDRNTQLPLSEISINSDAKDIGYTLKPQNITAENWKGELEEHDIDINIPMYSGFQMDTLPDYKITAKSFDGLLTPIDDRTGKSITLPSITIDGTNNAPLGVEVKNNAAITPSITSSFSGSVSNITTTIKPTDSSGNLYADVSQITAQVEQPYVTENGLERYPSGVSSDEQPTTGVLVKGKNNTIPGYVYINSNIPVPVTNKLSATTTGGTVSGTITNTITPIAIEAIVSEGTITKESLSIESTIPERSITIKAENLPSFSFDGPTNDVTVKPSTTPASTITGTFTRKPTDANITAKTSIKSADITLPNPPDYKIDGGPTVNVPRSIKVSNVQMVLNTSGESTVAERIVYQIVIEPISYNINQLLTVPAKSSIYIYVTGNNHRYPLWRSNHVLTVLQID